MIPHYLYSKVALFYFLFFSVQLGGLKDDAERKEPRAMSLIHVIITSGERRVKDTGSFFFFNSARRQRATKASGIVSEAWVASDMRSDP